jgi:hypothetical protein
MALHALWSGVFTPRGDKPNPRHEDNMTPRTFSAAASGARFLSDGTFSCSLGTLSLDEVSAARVNFEKFDVDGDGIISRADFGAAMCRHDLSFRDSSRREQLDTMYAAVDLDGTGQVTLEKFAVMRVRKKMHPTQRSQAQPRTLPAPNRTLPAPSRLPPPGPPAIGYASPRAAMPRPPSAMPPGIDMDEMSPTQQRQLDAMRKEMMQDRLEHAVMDYQQQAAMAAAAQAAAIASMSPRGGGGSFQVHLPPGATARGMGAPVPPLMLPAAGGGFANAGCGLTARGEAATGSGAGRLGGFATQRTTNYLMALSQAYYAANPHGNGWLPSRHMYDLLCQVAQQYALPLSAAQAAELCQNADAGDGYCNLHQVLGSDSFSHFFQQLAPGPEIAMRPGGALPSTASTAPTASRERSCEAGGYGAPMLSPRSQLPPTPPGYGVSQYTPRVDGAVAYGASQYTPRVPGAMVGYGGAAAYGDDADRLAALAAEVEARVTASLQSLLDDKLRAAAAAEAAAEAAAREASALTERLESHYEGQQGELQARHSMEMREMQTELARMRAQLREGQAEVEQEKRAVDDQLASLEARHADELAVLRDQMAATQQELAARRTTETRAKLELRARREHVSKARADANAARSELASLAAGRAERAKAAQPSVSSSFVQPSVGVATAEAHEDPSSSEGAAGTHGDDKELAPLASPRRGAPSEEFEAAAPPRRGLSATTEASIKAAAAAAVGSANRQAADATKREAKARVRAMQDEANEAASESVAAGADARRALQRGDLALAGQLAARAESRAAEARAKRRMAESLHASLGFTGQIGETPRGEAAPVDEEKLRASRQSAAAAAAAALTSRRSSEGGVTSRFGAALGMDADAAKERYEQLTPRTGAKAAQIASISSLMGAAADAEEDWTPAPTPREVTALRDGNGNCATKSPVAAAARGAGDGGAGDGGATARGDGGATARGDGGATARDGVTGDRSAAGSAGPIASPYVPQVPLHLVASAPKGGATVLSSRGVLHPSAHLSATEGAPKRSTGLLGRLGRRATKDKSGARVVRASSEERRSRASSDEEVEEGPEVDGPPPTDDLQRL